MQDFFIAIAHRLPYNKAMLRLIMTFLFVFLFLILSLPFLLVEYFRAKSHKREADYEQLHVVQWAFHVIAYLSGAKMTLIGMENVPADQPVLYIGNHQSIFDVVVAYGNLPNRTGFISKDSISKIPILSLYMKRIYCLFLNRANAREGLKTILQAIAYVKEGISIFIFPEGTRLKDKDETKLGEFHDGSFKIAQKTNCPIIPVSFNNTANLFETHLPWLRKTHVIVEFGKPIAYKDLSPEEQKHVGEYFRGIISEMVKKNQALV